MSTTDDTSSEIDFHTYDEEDPDDELGDVVEIDPPDLSNATFGAPEELWKLRRERKKRRKLAKKGYVQWFLIENGFPEPKFVKPKQNGAGTPEKRKGGCRYLFPKAAALPSEQQGMWTYVHRKGEADPVNLRDSTAHSIPADVLDEYIQMKVTASAPSLLDRLDLDPKDIVMYAFAALILFAILQSVLGGGL